MSLTPSTLAEEHRQVFQTGLEQLLLSGSNPDQENYQKVQVYHVHTVHDPGNQKHLNKSDYLDELSHKVDQDMERLRLLAVEADDTRKKLLEGKVDRTDEFPDWDPKEIVIHDPRDYYPDSEEDLPIQIRIILYYYYWQRKIPADCNCKVTVSCHGRKSRTNVGPIDDKTVCRAVLHLGPVDVYSFSEKLKSGYCNKTKVTMVNGGNLLMDHDTCYRRTVYVPAGTMITFPSMLPEDYADSVKEQMSKMGLGGANRKKIDNQRVRNQIAGDSRMIKKKVRLRDYRRYTVVLDFGPSKLVSEDSITDIIKREGGDQIIDGMKSMGIPDHIAAAMPNHVKHDILDKVAKMPKMANMVGRIAENVKRDVTGHDGVQKDQMDKETITAITKSVFDNMDINEIKANAAEIEEIANSVIPKEARRQARNRKRREARKRHHAQQRMAELAKDTDHGDDLEMSV